MDVGNDPFPRDEVTGLAAFENLEPVSSLNVVPEGREPESIAPESAPEAQETQETHAAEESVEERRDPTLPLDLTVDQLPADPNQTVELPYASSAPEAESAAAALPEPEEDQTGEHLVRGDADHLFDASHGNGGWDDPDEATRVATSRAHGPSTNLQMDWDEDEEPPTQARPDAMFQVPPLSANTGWDESDSSTSIYEDPDELQEDIDEDDDEPPSALPRYTAVQTMSGGRPSPFPAAASAPIPSLRDFGLSRVAQASAAVMDSLRSARQAQPQGLVAALRAGDRRAWQLTGGAALGLIALALIIRGLTGGSSSSSVMFATTPSDAKVFVDGKEVAGSSSPYSLPEVAAGKHELVVKKAGYKDYTGSFAVARGETKSLPGIELVPSVRETGFSVRSSPAGASVWVDGNATDQVTPTRMTGVAPGIHRLQLKHPGYADFELQLFVPDATVLQLPAAELVATVEPPTPKEPEPVARMRKSRGDDQEDEPVARTRRSRGSDDQEDDLSDGRRSSRASASRGSWRNAGSSRGSSSSSSSSSSASSSRSWRSGGSSSHSAAAPVLATTAHPAAPIEPTSSGKLGTLRINSRPWAQVFVDGRMVGNTPQQGVPLSAGKHKVQLVNPQMGLKKNVSVTIKAGQVTTQVVTLAE